MEFRPNEANRDIVVAGFVDRLKIYPLHSPRRRLWTSGSLGNLKLMTWKENGEKDTVPGCVLS